VKKIRSMCAKDRRHEQVRRPVVIWRISRPPRTSKLMLSVEA